MVMRKYTSAFFGIMHPLQLRENVDRSGSAWRPVIVRHEARLTSRVRFLLRRVAPLPLVAIALFGPGCAAPTGGGEGEGTVGSDLTSANEKTAFDFFVGKGVTELQAAAIVVNLQQKSNVSPTSVQPGGPGARDRTVVDRSTMERHEKRQRRLVRQQARRFRADARPSATNVKGAKRMHPPLSRASGHRERSAVQSAFFAFSTAHTLEA